MGGAWNESDESVEVQPGGKKISLGCLSHHPIGLFPYGRISKRQASP